MTEDADDEPAVITRGQLRDLLEMRDNYKHVDWLMGFIVRVSKWCAVVAGLVIAAQTIYANLVRGLIVK